MFQSLSLLAIAALVASTSGAAIQRRAPNPTAANTCPLKSAGATVADPLVPGSFNALVTIAVGGSTDALGFSLLAATGISVVPETTIRGNIGVSPVPISYITGFAITKQSGYATSQYVTYLPGQGKVFGADTPGSLTPHAVDLMGEVYSNANLKVTDYAECHSGVLDDLVMTHGTYEWSTSVSLSTTKTVYLTGTNDQYFIMKSAGAFNFAAGSFVNLSGGMTADNVFWIAATSLTVAGSSHFKGVAMTYTNIVIADNAIVQGRLYAQTEIALAKGSFVYLPSDVL